MWDLLDVAEALVVERYGDDVVKRWLTADLTQLPASARAEAHVLDAVNASHVPLVEQDAEQLAAFEAMFDDEDVVG